MYRASSSIAVRLFHSSSVPRFSSSPSPSSSSTSTFDLDGALSHLGTAFGDSRLDIEDALESLGTTYYPSDIQIAIESVDGTLKQFEAIQKELGPSSPQAIKLRESWSLRLEQLKQELQQAIEKGGGEEH